MLELSSQNSTKACGKCKVVREFVAYGKDRRARDGLQVTCKPCSALAKAIYRKAHPDKVAAVETKRNEKRLVAKRAYMAARYSMRKKELQAAQAAYRRRDPQRIAQQKSRYAKANPEVVRASNAARRALAKSVCVAPKISFKAIAQAHGYQCFYCGTAVDPLKRRALHIDHVVPLSRGGAHAVENLVCSCAGCNLSKGAMTGEEFLNGKNSKGGRRTATA